MLGIRLSPVKNEESSLDEGWVLAVFLGQTWSWLACLGLLGCSGYLLSSCYI